MSVFGRGAWGPISDTFSELTNIIQRDADRQARHEEAMAGLELQNKQMEVNLAHQQRRQVLEDLQIAQAEEMMRPTTINMKMFQNPAGDPYNAAHLSQISDKLADVMSDGQGHWDPNTLDLVGADGEPIEMPTFEAQRRLGGGFGVLLSHTDPYKAKQRDIFMLNDQLDEHNARKPKEKDYKQGDFPKAILDWKNKRSSLQGQINNLQTEYDDPKFMKQAYLEKLTEIEEMRGQLLASGAGDRVLNYFDEAVERYEGIIETLDKKVAGVTAGNTDFERGYAQWIQTPQGTNPKTGQPYGRWVFKNNIWNPNRPGDVTLKELNYSEWKSFPANKNKTLMDFEKEYKKATTMDITPGGLLKMADRDIFVEIPANIMDSTQELNIGSTDFVQLSTALSEKYGISVMAGASLVNDFLKNKKLDNLPPKKREEVLGRLFRSSDPDLDKLAAEGYIHKAGKYGKAITYKQLEKKAHGKVTPKDKEPVQQIDQTKNDIVQKLQQAFPNAQEGMIKRHKGTGTTWIFRNGTWVQR